MIKRWAEQATDLFRSITRINIRFTLAGFVKDRNSDEYDDDPLWWGKGSRFHDTMLFSLSDRLREAFSIKRQKMVLYMSIVPITKKKK